MDKKEIIKYLTELRSDYEKRVKVNEENNQNFIGMYNIAYFNAITDVLNYINNNADDKNNKTESTNSHFSLNNKITLKEFFEMFDYIENTQIEVILDKQDRNYLLFYQNSFSKEKIIAEKSIQYYLNFLVKEFGFDNMTLIIHLSNIKR